MPLSTFLCPNCGYQDLHSEEKNLFSCRQCFLSWCIFQRPSTLARPEPTTQALFEAASERFDETHVELLNELGGVQP